MANPFIQEILDCFQPDDLMEAPDNLHILEKGDLPSWFAVSDLAAASFACAGLMLLRHSGLQDHSVTVDKRLASFWFDMTLRPLGWQLPPLWDAIAGDYRTKDGWIRLHTNAPHHRISALSVLGDYDNRAALETVVSSWAGDDLESAIVGAGGCAAVMRDLENWAKHPQGAAVAKEPLIIWDQHGSIKPNAHQFPGDKPLAGIRVLDLTRVLAGPVASRFLAGYGADVLRIDPAQWDEPGVVPEVTLGKRCAGLDLKNNADRAVFEALLAEADVILHGYRPSALDKLGYGANALRRINPNLIDVALNAYGWSGPWAGRRGFDSLMQMSCGIADYGMKMSGSGKPTPMPVQALDHATGYLLAGAVIQALYKRTNHGEVLSARLSLARTAHLLSGSKRRKLHPEMRIEDQDDLAPEVEPTGWGPAKRINFPLKIDGLKPHWPFPAGQLRTSPAKWRQT